MKTYNDSIAKNDQIELVLMSSDRGDDKALAWSKKENFPWPQVMRSNVKRHYNFMAHRSRFVPQYVLVDKAGNKVAEGLGEALKHLKLEKSK